MGVWSLAWDAWYATYVDSDAIGHRQRARLVDLVAFARARSGYYRDLYRSLPGQVDDLRRVPPVHKPELMARFDEWVTEPTVRRADVERFIADRTRVGEPYAGRHLVATTSGTTGVPAIVLHDPESLRVYGAVAIARASVARFTGRTLWRCARRRGRQAALYSVGHYVELALIKRIHYAHPSVRTSTLTLDILSPLPDIVRELNVFQPAVLASFPSMLDLLAREQNEERLRIRPALVMPTGETLTPAVRTRIETAFACVVRNGYGASEAPLLALSECRHGWLHLNADWHILEPVDAQYQPVPPGQLSDRVLLTNLANRIQPFIRYEMGDRVLVKPDPCPCGSMLPALRVEGRTDEVLRLTTASGTVGDIGPMQLETIVEETPGVYRYQIIQTGSSTLRVCLDARPPADRTRIWSLLESRIRAYLTAQKMSSVRLELADEMPAADPRSGKLRQVWSVCRDHATPDIGASRRR